MQGWQSDGILNFRLWVVGFLEMGLRIRHVGEKVLPIIRGILMSLNLAMGLRFWIKMI